MRRDDFRRTELAHFLRRRRESIDPTEVGLPKSRRRRTPGLRREEVAILAGLSPTWYTYLEQARSVSPSPEVIDSLAGTLGLSAEERAYVHKLAHADERPEPPARWQGDEQLLQELAESLSPLPTYVSSWLGDVLSWNDAAAECITDFGRLPAARRNILLWMLTDTAARDRFVDWEAEARDLVARFRTASADWPDDPRLAALVRELSQASPDFRRWWDEHRVGGPPNPVHRMRHRSVERQVVATRTIVLHEDETSPLHLVVALPVDADSAAVTAPPVPPAGRPPRWTAPGTGTGAAARR